MPNHTILPLSVQGTCHSNTPEADPSTQAQLAAWLAAQAAYMRHTWAPAPAQACTHAFASASACADALIQVLLHRCFNHQAKGRLAQALPALRSHLAPQIANGRPIPLFLLYNGGYRASPFPEGLALIFEPDQTEFMLLLQITRLQEKISALYAPGMDFVIVVNNGVSRWVNGISPDITEAYGAQLRGMIASLGARVRVLLQSELSSFTDHLPFTPAPSLPALSDQEHRIVERFLARPCSAPEAQYQQALYSFSEATWAQLLRPIVLAEGATVLRQVASPGMLSFRPFAGGAIRSQNGSVGFQMTDGAPVAKLITAETFNRYQVQLAHIDCTTLVNRES